MIHQRISTSGNTRGGALLIDVENLSVSSTSAIIAAARACGALNHLRAYGDWASPNLGEWRKALPVHGIRPIQRFDAGPKTNGADFALVIDAIDLFHVERPDFYCIASADGDFTALAVRLRSSGVPVYCLGGEKAAKALVAACTPVAPARAATDTRTLPPVIVALLLDIVALVADDGGRAPTIMRIGQCAGHAGLRAKDFGFASIARMLVAAGRFRIERDTVVIA